MGQGLMLNELKKKSNEKKLLNLEFLPEVPMTEVGKFLISADALFIHLSKNKLFEITIPGKTQAYMSIGRPIIMGVDGDAADLINKARCGVTIEPENGNQLAYVAEHLSELEKTDIAKLGLNAKNFYDRNLSVQCGIEKFAKLFNEVIN